MNVAVLAILTLLSIYTLATYGIARTAAAIYLPAMLFCYGVKEVSLPGIPNLTSASAVGYPMLLMLPLCWREVQRVRWNVIDLMMALMMIPTTISAALNTSLWDGVGRTGDAFFIWILPYFLGRLLMQDVKARETALKSICISVIIIALLAVFEARLRPYFVSRSLRPLNLNTVAAGQVFSRFGFMRAQVTLGHSIDLGLCGVMCGGLILILTPSVGRKLLKPLTVVGIGACGMMVFTSISFTAIGAMTAAVVLFFVFQQRWFGKMLVVPAVICLGIAICYIMGTMLNTTIGDRPTDKLEESAWIRVKLLQDAWAGTDKIPGARDAGAFGLGRYLDFTGVGSGSVDNSYLLFLIQYGWIYLLGWIVLALVVAFKGSQMIGLAEDSAEKRLPAAAAMAAYVAVLLGMYTVFYGFVYAMLMCLLMGIIASMYQIFRYGAPATPAISVAGYPMNAPLGLVR